jgi:hypothetical protein
MPFLVWKENWKKKTFLLNEMVLREAERLGF